MPKTKPLSPFMRQFELARRQVEELKRLYPGSAQWAVLQFPRPAQQPQGAKE